MKKHILIFIFSLLLLFLKAQDTKIPFTDFYPKNKIDFPFSSVPLINIYSQKSIKDLSLRTELPKLPFFCNIEEKCRNKFNFFLKLRAGNDEAYEKMIHNK